MKKIVIVILATLLLVGCTKKPKDDKIADMSGYNIKSEQFLVMSMEEAYDFLTSETGLVYFGFDTCPWCFEMIPYLNEIAEAEKVNIYYIDCRPGGNDIRNDDNAAYMKIVDFTKEFLVLDENGNPRLYVPQLFAVVNGKIVFDHADTVPDHNASERKMTEEEVELMKQILKDFVNSVK